MADSPKSSGPLIITVLVVVLIVLHQDVWFWNDSRLVFGFLPVGMAWHIGISISAAVVWAWATRIAWPVDESAAAADSEGDQG